jgi:hypothetical protein
LRREIAYHIAAGSGLQGISSRLVQPKVRGNCVRTTSAAC